MLAPCTREPAAAQRTELMYRMMHAPPLGSAQEGLMRKSLVSAAAAVTAVLALEYFALSTSIGPVARAQTSLNCPVAFERLRSELEDADEEDSTGLNNHYWAVVVNRQGIVCAVAYSGRDRDSQWLLSRQIAAAKAFTANGLSLDDAPISTAQLYPWVQPGAPANPLFGLANGNPVNPDAAYRGQLQPVRDAQRSHGRSARRRHDYVRRRACALLPQRHRRRPRPLGRYGVRRSFDRVALAGEPPAGAAGAERYDHAEREVGASALSERPRHAGGDAVGGPIRACRLATFAHLRGHVLGGDRQRARGLPANGKQPDAAEHAHTRSTRISFLRAPRSSPRGLTNRRHAALRQVSSHSDRPSDFGANPRGFLGGAARAQTLRTNEHVDGLLEFR